MYTNRYYSKMEKSFDIQMELCEISCIFSQYTYGLQTRLDSKKSRITINQDDLDYLIQIQEKINNIAKLDITSLRTDVSKQKEQLQQKLQESELEISFKDGQLSTITNVLKMCYTDYQNSNRPDAMLAIEAAVKDAQIST